MHNLFALNRDLYGDTDHSYGNASGMFRTILSKVTYDEEDVGASSAVPNLISTRYNCSLLRQQVPFIPSSRTLVSPGDRASHIFEICPSRQAERSLTNATFMENEKENPELNEHTYFPAWFPAGNCQMTIFGVWR